MPPLLLLALKLTVVLGLAGLVTALLRRRSAASRHLVWGLALAGTLLLPAASGIVPRVEMAVLPAVVPAPAAPAVTAPAATSRTLDGAAADAASAGAPAAAPFALPPLLPLLWMAGTGVMVALVTLSLFATARVARRATPVRAGPMAGELAEARRLLGVVRPVTLLLGRGAPMPMTWGALRPVILLPDHAVDWAPARRRDVLLHELAHVKRLDWLTQLGARIACAAYWWHPLAWVAARRLREERELACDDLVLRHGAVAPDYAHHLLEIARGLATVRGTALTGVAMARPSQLAGRLLAVLDGTRARAELSRRQALPAAGLAALLLIPLAGLTMAARHVPMPEPLPAPATAPVATAAPGTTLCAWDRIGESSASHSNIDDDRVTITIVVDGCELTVRSRGRVIIAEDERDVADLGIDSWFEIEERSPARERRRAEFERRDSRVMRRWFVDGAERPWDAAAAEWFQGALQVTFRRTSFQARARAERLYARGGAQALLAEIEQLHASSALTAYLEVYAGRERIGAAEARRIAEIAARRISSSSNLAHVLTTLLRNPGLDEAARLEIVAATRAISSSSERARVLVATTEAAALTTRMADAVLTSAAEISSSSERARVLTTVGHALPAETPLPDTYVTAARGINSSSELARVLRGLLQRDRLTPARLQAVVALSGSIGSSSERASVLRAVAAQQPDAATTHAVLAAARDIGSSSEKASVLVALAEARLVTTEDLRAAYRQAAETIGSRSERQRALAAIGVF